MYNLREFKEIFDPILEEYLDQRLQKFTQLTTDDFVKEFTSYSKNLTMASGKRVRPYLAFIMYLAMGGKSPQSVLKFLVSIEIFHTFALVHDDIMDKATTRHSVKTINAFVSDTLKEQKRYGDHEYGGNSQAILVGDLLFAFSTQAFEMDNGFDKNNLQKTREYFYKMIDEVILGQMLDIDLATKENADIDLINEKTRLKTSRYSCVRPMQMGAALANPDSNMDEFCESVGTKAGIAFQLQDDMLDIMGDPKTLTKSTLRDIAEHQHTFFTNYVLENGTAEQKEYFKSIFGKEIEESEKEKVRKLFIDTGAIEAGKKLIMENLDEAKKDIENSNLGEEYKNHLKELLDVLAQRQS